MNRLANRMMTSMLAVGTMALLCLAGAANSVAQTPTGSITGTVADAQGLAVEGADVTLTNQQTNYTYKSATSSTGAYQFSSIDYGIYSVKVGKAGFRNGVVENIKLDAATAYTVAPIRLELGVATQSVVVEAGAESVNTTSAEVSSTVERQQIEELPILDRHPLALLQIEAGISMDPNPNGNATTIGGQRSSFSNLTLDGINIQDNFIRTNDLDFSPNYPFSSQAQEFTVINQNSDVDQGGGSSQVSIVTPKGTNKYHGEGFWYYRANSFAANDWFNDASGVPIPKLLQNQGGGNIGGPIIKDKLFVYGWYELLRLKESAPNNTTVLSPTILSSLENATPSVPFTYQPVNASTGAADGPTQTVNLLTVLNQSRGNPSFDSSGNYLGGAPIFTVDPTMAALLKRMPTTFNNTRVGDGTNLLGYQLNARSDDTLDNYGVRVDYDINPHNTVTGTWAWNRQIVDRPDIDTSFDLVPLVQNNDSIKFLSTGWRWSPITSFTNEVRFGFNLAPAFFTTSQNFSAGYVLTDSTLPFTDPNPNFLPQGRNTRTWAWLDNATWVKGNHTLKFGTQIERVTIFTTGSGGIYPSYALGFSGVNPYGPLASDFPVTNAADSISTADLGNATSILASVAGILNQVSQTDNVTSEASGYVPGAPQNRNYRQNLWAFYLGDQWRITRKLTLTYGTRWEYYSPVDERDGLVLLPEVPAGTSSQAALLGNATLDFAGGPSGRPLYRPRLNQFAPNVGLAWDPFGNGKTAVRAGFSMNYINDEYFTAANNAAAGNTGLQVTATGPLLTTPPTSQVLGYAGPTVANPQGNNVVPAPPFGIPTTFLTNAINATNSSGYIGNLAGYSIDPNLKTPYLEQWNLSIQRDIGWNTSLTVSYVGNHGVGLLRAIDVNQLNLNAGGFLADFNRARVNGFQSLAANGTFDPTYQGTASQPCPACQPLTVFPLLPSGGPVFGPGYINYGPFTNLIYQGQPGALAADYQADEFFSGFGVPGPSTNILNVFPNPYIMGGDLLKNTSFSSYNAGVVEVRRRFSRGLYFQANYTYSKVMTDFGGSQSQFQPFQDNARSGLEKQRAPFDLTHAFKGNFTYELPIGKGHALLSSGNKLLGLLVDGWKTGSIITLQSGEPFSIVSQYATFNRGGSRSVNNTAVATLSHQQLSSDLGTFVQPNGVVYLINPKLISPNGTGAPANPQLSCVPAMTGGFCNPQPGEVGNLQLDAFNGPVYFDWDLSAGKDFNLTEKLKLTFRTEAFNVLNHPTFAVPTDPLIGNYDMNINSTTFGQSTALASTPRRLQFSLLLKF
jgi:hypothetical protein